MYRYKELSDMRKHIQDLLVTWMINLAALAGINIIDVELILKNLVLIATLVYTVIKIVQVLTSWKKKKEIKEEE